ncbi:MAG: GNAT family N-acetyltransferase [Nitriliruptorales bacterium]|nr:GNAT family N-acetyltransferase [Nitriliruptorales bacterium]
MSELRIRRARIEEIRPLAEEYDREASAASETGKPWDAPLPQGGIFWIAEDAETGDALGYAAGTLRQTGCTVGPVFARKQARRSGVGRALIGAIQDWADDTRVPVVEISVAADNEEGRTFLQALGYVPRRIMMSLRPAVRGVEDDDGEK